MNEEETVSWYQKTWVILLFLIFLFPIGIYLAWKHTNWKKSSKIILSILSIFIFLGILGSSTSSPTITSLTIESNNMELEINQTSSIRIKYDDPLSNINDIEFISDNDNIIFEKDVDHSTNGELYGKITGIADTSGHIYVKTSNSSVISNKVNVTVIDSQNRIQELLKQEQIKQAAEKENQEKQRIEEQARQAKQDANLTQATNSTTSSEKSSRSSSTQTTSKANKTQTSSHHSSQSHTVYYTRTGECYHYANPCGRGTYYPCTLSQAQAKGLRPCQKCVH